MENFLLKILIRLRLIILIFAILRFEYLLNAYNNTASVTPNEHIEKFQTVMAKARIKAFEGGLYGASAGSIQVLTLMWLRTAVNYQYRYGVSFGTALQQLYLQGGISRFYRGLSYALIQGPLSKFGSVAANEGSKVLIQYYSGSSDSYLLTSALGSVLSMLWRLFLMPVDTCKTVLQVEGVKGFNLLWKRLLQGDFGVLYQGSLATVLSTFAGHYPWFFVHNILDSTIKESPTNNTAYNIIRSASIGFVASAVSDTVSNFIRVIKTVKQSIVSVDNLSYIQVINKIYSEGGLYGLFFRGLITRIFANGLQSMLFTVLWKLLPTFQNNLRRNDNNINNNK